MFQRLNPPPPAVTVGVNRYSQYFFAAAADSLKEMIEILCGTCGVPAVSQQSLWGPPVGAAAAHGVGKCYCTRGRLRAEGDARLFRGRTRQIESNESDRVKI